MKKTVDDSNLSSVGPLDWLLTDSEPEPPVSPKQVSTSGQVGRGQQEASSSQGSSGTDTETRTLLSQQKAEMRGAIPKRRLNQGHDGESESGSQHNRRAFRRRQSSSREQTNDSPDGIPAESDSIDLRQRILEILSTPNNEECERELSKLKSELEARKRLAKELLDSRSESRPSTGSRRHQWPSEGAHSEGKD